MPTTPRKSWLPGHPVLRHGRSHGRDAGHELSGHQLRLFRDHRHDHDRGDGSSPPIEENIIVGRKLDDLSWTMIEKSDDTT